MSHHGEVIHQEEMMGQNRFEKQFLKKKKLESKRVKNIYLISLVANTDRPIISKSNWIEENLNDANRSFKNKKKCSKPVQLVQKPKSQNHNNIVIGHLTVNPLRNI